MAHRILTRLLQQALQDVRSFDVVSVDNIILHICRGFMSCQLMTVVTLQASNATFNLPSPVLPSHAFFFFFSFFFFFFLYEKSRIRTHKRFKRTPFIRTKRNMRIFRYSPLSSSTKRHLTRAYVLRFTLGLSKEVCLHADADWLKTFCQSEGGERSVTGMILIRPSWNLNTDLSFTVRETSL